MSYQSEIVLSPSLYMYTRLQFLSTCVVFKNKVEDDCIVQLFVFRRVHICVNHFTKSLRYAGGLRVRVG